MAGAAPITTNLAEMLKRAASGKFAGRADNELDIFLSLCVGRVYLDQPRSILYFVDHPTLSVSQIIDQVFSGLNQKPVFEQRYMDEHKVLKAATCIQLSAQQLRIVLVALNIRGVHIDMSKSGPPKA